MSTLRQILEASAAQFAQDIVQALRGASLQELMTMTDGIRAVSLPKGGGAPLPKKVRGGRLVRRSTNDIRETLGKIVALLGEHPSGLRAEQIKAELSLDKREMPKPIAEGLSTGALSKVGNKRATTYFAGGAAAKVTGPGKRPGGPGKRPGGPGKRKAASKK